LSDIFREVEEDVRREKLEKLWKAYGTHVIVLLVLALIGIAGFEVWQRYEANLRDKDSAAFAAAQRIPDPKAAANAFATLGKTAHGGYGPLSRMAQADIASSDHGNLGAVARLRAGWLTVDTAPHVELQTLLQPLLDPGSVWRQMAEEILAYSDYRAGKLLAADAEFARIAADTTAPDALRTRAHTFDAFLSGGGAANYGSVPPPAPPSAINPDAGVPGAGGPGPPADPSLAGGATP
jgi:hypothetical protein